MTVLFVLLAVSNFTKPLQHINDPAHGGIVVFGYKFASIGFNVLFGTIFGVILLAYAWGIFRLQRWVLPLAIAYAFYQPANMVLFWFAHGGDPNRSLQFIITYVSVALTGSVGTALYLAYHREILS